MKKWYQSAYEQLGGQSTRTHEFARELVRRRHEVTLFTNSFCHFKHTDLLDKRELWRLEMVDSIRVD